MARIRTVKPEFFRNEGLQDLETENPGKYVMLVFAGLWGLCDNQGVFEYRPRQIKLDILPFLNFEMEETLSILENAGYFKKYEKDGKLYCHIESFRDHQRINGKEAGPEGKRYPVPGECIEKQQGSNREATGKQLPAQERKGKGIGKESIKNSAIAVSEDAELKGLAKTYQLSFETNPSTKILMWEKSLASRTGKSLKTLAEKTEYYAKETGRTTREIGQEIMQAFRDVCRENAKITFDPTTLVTEWVWKLVLSKISTDAGLGDVESVKAMLAGNV